MNRFTPLTLAFLLISGFCAAQTYSLCNQVIASTGRSVVKQGNTWAYTVGEPVVSTFIDQSVNRVLTQGFHQPDLCLYVSTNETSELADWDVLLYPNPTADLLNIQFSAEKGGVLNASVVDLLGHVLISDLHLDTPSGNVLDCSNWQPGIYLLRLQDPESRASATVRFIRL